MHLRVVTDKKYEVYSALFIPYVRLNYEGERLTLYKPMSTHLARVV